ncbi:helix-turn-helix domain-containing protein [Streptomyces sp. LHD-70]|uniref:helix-turn-helix domain-containing protein n=1 Tax=Streptomyces sp. LHD-70 TaxID=3072140 RepID=UPI00280DFBC4|nr:helix-turn-helix domain-containing protein [Streptomyces sp. LHD-70]MDQ8707852.1 helix-turn-helix domain-containing protein [Streptomyces sp. LHD-70]
MSIEAMAWAFRQKITNPGAKLVLLALCDFADESWSCFPGQETLAAKTSQGERTVRRHLEWLEREGFIVSRARFAHGRRTSNRYTIRNPRPSAPPPVTRSAWPRLPSPKPDDEGAKQAARLTGGQIDQRTDHAEQPANLAGEPSENHQQKNPLPQPEDDQADPGRRNRCAAHPEAPGLNCRGCGTNPRAQRETADIAARQEVAEHERLSTQRWLQGLRARRGQVAQQERDGTLAEARRAARDAVQRHRDGRAPDPGSDREILTESDQD